MQEDCKDEKTLSTAIEQLKKFFSNSAIVRMPGKNS